jgi:hypothetical protein
MGGDIDKKTALAALEYFVPFTENYNKHAATKLCKSGSSTRCAGYKVFKI